MRTMTINTKESYAPKELVGNTFQLGLWNDRFEMEVVDLADCTHVNTLEYPRSEEHEGTVSLYLVQCMEDCDKCRW